jgi:hypothetical protein
VIIWKPPARLKPKFDSEDKRKEKIDENKRERVPEIIRREDEPQK